MVEITSITNFLILDDMYFDGNSRFVSRNMRYFKSTWQSFLIVFLIAFLCIVIFINWKCCRMKKLSPKLWNLLRYQTWINKCNRRLTVWTPILFKYVYYWKEEILKKEKLTFKGGCLSNFYFLGECQVNIFHSFVQFLL